MASKHVRHVDFEALVLINKKVVSLTREKHEYNDEDERRIRSMLENVERVGTESDSKDAIPEEASLLIFRVASGQYFHEGNKRTALVAGLSFLQMNGFTFDIENAHLVAVVDKAGVSTATLNDVRDALARLIRSVR